MPKIKTEGLPTEVNNTKNLSPDQIDTMEKRTINDGKKLVEGAGINTKGEVEFTEYQKNQAHKEMRTQKETRIVTLEKLKKISTIIEKNIPGIVNETENIGYIGKKDMGKTKISLLNVRVEFELILQDINTEFIHNRLEELIDRINKIIKYIDQSDYDNFKIHLASFAGYVEGLKQGRFYS